MSSKDYDIYSMFPRLIRATARYDFEYEEDEEDDSGDVDIENKYYNAKQMKMADPEDALAEFLEIQSLEQEKGEWGFKGLKQAIKLEVKLGKYDQVRGLICPFFSPYDLAGRLWLLIHRSRPQIILQSS